ncbi:MAG: hypothetical protein NVSMB9_34820 [Isosphaeraceae bacterium]
MKTWTAFALLLVLGSLPVLADEKDKVATLRGEIELLKIQRDVDKTLLREAMLLEGRRVMKPRTTPPNDDRARKLVEEEQVILKNFIDRKRDDLVKRTLELGSKASELAALKNSVANQGTPRPNPNATTGATPINDKDREALFEKMEDAQVEVQLLQTQAQLYQQGLNQALHELANAEFAASQDKAQQDKADQARKGLDKAKNHYLSINKKFHDEQRKLSELQSRLGMIMGPGVGGGFQ